jgi:hypothetical protein
LLLLDIPWAGIGAFLLGAGSALSGYAAVVTARRSIGTHQKDSDTSSDRISDGSGEWIPDSDSNE